MNWEQNYLNRIHKTEKFKVIFKNPCQIKNKIEYLSRVEYFLSRYTNSNFKVNKNGAIYLKVSPKKTFYFDYLTNYMFNAYCHFFTMEEEFGVECESKHLKEKWRVLLIDLHFMKSYDKEKFTQFLKMELNEFFKFRNFLIGYEVSIYDVVLLSIIQYSHLWKDKEESFTKSEFLSIGRWINFMEKTLEIK